MLKCKKIKRLSPKDKEIEQLKKELTLISHELSYYKTNPKSKPLGWMIFRDGREDDCFNGLYDSKRAAQMDLIRDRERWYADDDDGDESESANRLVLPIFLTEAVARMVKAQRRTARTEHPYPEDDPDYYDNWDPHACE
jgi:hypothetical protein